MNNYYVYLHIKKTNGEPFYVGKGNRKRCISKHGRNTFWYNTVEKYGFDVIFLEKNLTDQEAKDLEIYWIKRIGRRDLNTGPLVNLSPGGDGGGCYIRKPETLKKMSENYRGENNPMYGKKWDEEYIGLFREKLSGENNPMYGRSVYSVWVEKFGEEVANKKEVEWKRKIKENSTGRSISEEGRKSISQKNKGWGNGRSSIYLNPITGIYYAAYELEELLGLKKSTILAQITGKNSNRTGIIKV